jgi:hypothetical protein
VALSVFSGVRTDQAASFLRRLADAKAIKRAEWAELLPIIEQLGIINDRRNQILPHGAAYIESGRGIVSNKAFAITRDRVRSFPISAEILEDMTADLRKINVHLLIKHMGRPALRGKYPGLRGVLAASWRYIPPPLSQGRSPRGAKRPKREGQRSTSPE